MYFSWWPRGFGFSGLLLGLVLVVAVVWLLRRVSASATHRQGARADRDDALRILRRRLAEGDISEEEFERLRRAVLS